MRVGERGQVVIPKAIRDRFGIGPDTEVEFHIVGPTIVLRKSSQPLALDKWRGKWKNTLKDLGYKSVDEAIEDSRGR